MKDKALRDHRQQFYTALKIDDEQRAAASWNAVVDIVGGDSWSTLPSSYDTVRALGVLATLRTNTICVPGKIPLSNLPNLVNSMLLQPRERRCWTHAFELLCRARGLNDLLDRHSVQEKCDRNLTEDGFQPPIDRRAGPVFDFFFPEGAFRRLTLDD